MRRPLPAGTRATRRGPARRLRGRRRGDAPGPAARLVPRPHMGRTGGVRGRPRRASRLATAVAPAGRRPARRPRRRNRSGRAHGPARVALPGREPPRLPPGHAVARGLDPPAPRRRPRAGRRVRRRAQLVPMALPLADGLDRPGAPGRRRRSARRRRRPRPRHDRGGYVAPRPRARRRRPGRGRCDGPRGRRGWLRLGVAARPRCGAQHERRRPGPLSRRPGALERPRARDGEPAAARAPRPGSVHGAARPVGVRPCAGRPLANGAPRSGRGRRARVPVRAACGPLPGRVGSGACAAGPRAARRLDRARGRRRRSGLARPAGRHLPPLRRLRRHHLDGADEPDRRPGRCRAGDRAPARPCGPGARGAGARRRRRVEDRPPRRRPGGRVHRRRRGRRGGHAARLRGPAPLAAIRPVPGARPGRPGGHRRRARPPRAAADRPPGGRGGDRRGRRSGRRLDRARGGRAGPGPCAGHVAVPVAANWLRRPVRGDLASSAWSRPGVARRVRADGSLRRVHDPRPGQGAPADVPGCIRRRRPSGADGATSSAPAGRPFPAVCGSSPRPALRRPRAVRGPGRARSPGGRTSSSARRRRQPEAARAAKRCRPTAATPSRSWTSWSSSGTSTIGPEPIRRSRLAMFSRSRSASAW